MQQQIDYKLRVSGRQRRSKR